MTDLPDIFKYNELSAESTKQELLRCNERSVHYGLLLSDNDITVLLHAREDALKNAGRLEFSGGILPKLITAFCSSHYIDSTNYVDTLAELQEVFYYFKSEAMELLSDDELIENMVSVFNGRAQGSVEYLSGTSLEALCRHARNPYDERNADEAEDLF